MTDELMETFPEEEEELCPRCGAATATFSYRGYRDETEYGLACVKCDWRER